MLLEVIQFLVPGAKLVLIGEPSNNDEYLSQVTWADLRPQPSWAEVEQARPAVQQAQALADVQHLRHSAYVAESDPLFFGWQRGENTEVVWLAKVQEIRSRFPGPTNA